LEIPLVNLIVAGILEGSIYALIALGISLIIGVMNIVNVAHGDLMIFGAISAFWLCSLFGMDPFLTIVIVVPLTFGAGVFIQKFIVGPSIRHVEYATTASLIVTYGLALIIMQSEFLVWSPDYRIITTSYTGTNVAVGDYSFNLMRLIGLAVVIGIFILLRLMTGKTGFGRAIRACTQDRDAARTLGVNFEKMAYLTFGLSASLASIAGLLYILTHVLNPAYGFTLTIKGFVALILGGMGSLAGPLIAGLLIGVFENLGVYYFGGLWKDTVPYIILLIVLLIRPRGILGKEEA